MNSKLEIEVEELKNYLHQVIAALDQKEWKTQYEMMKSADRISFRIYMMTDTGE